MTSTRQLIILVLLLTAIGLITVGNASGVNAIRDFGNQWYYLRAQAIWAGVGLLGFVFFSRFNHRNLESLAVPALAISLMLLIAVLIPGIGLKLLGARRWLNFGFFTLQPAELTKLSLFIYLSSLLKKQPDIFRFFASVILICFLIMLEPDLGTTLTLLSSALILFFTVAKDYSRLFFLLPLLGLAFTGLIILSPYRAARLRTFLDYSHDPSGASYHIRQAVLGFGSGGWFGVGLGQSRQKYEFLPEVTTDSIFAIIGEEMGLIGGVVILILYLLFFLATWEIVLNTPEGFSRNLAISMSAILTLQTCINLSSITALLPFTGIPLTFISYGGSALIVSLSAAGILVNISTHHGRN